MTYRLTKHIRQQAVAKAVPLVAIDAVITDPDYTYPTERPGQSRYVKNDLCVVVEHRDDTDYAITVFANAARYVTPLRPDQLP
jgi:hypothetical protein